MHFGGHPLYIVLGHILNVTVFECLVSVSAKNDIARVDQIRLILGGWEVEHTGKGGGGKGLPLWLLVSEPVSQSPDGWFLIYLSGLFGKLKCSEVYEAYFGNWKAVNTFSWHCCKRKPNAYTNHMGFVRRQRMPCICRELTWSESFSPHLIGVLLSIRQTGIVPVWQSEKNEIQETKCLRPHS